MHTRLKTVLTVLGCALLVVGGSEAPAAAKKCTEVNPCNAFDFVDDYAAAVAAASNTTPPYEVHEEYGILVSTFTALGRTFQMDYIYFGAGDDMMSLSFYRTDGSRSYIVEVSRSPDVPVYNYQNTWPQNLASDLPALTTDNSEQLTGAVIAILKSAYYESAFSGYTNASPKGTKTEYCLEQCSGSGTLYGLFSGAVGGAACFAVSVATGVVTGGPGLALAAACGGVTGVVGTKLAPSPAGCLDECNRCLDEWVNCCASTPKCEPANSCWKFASGCTSSGVPILRVL